MPFEYLDDEAIADVAFRAQASTLEKLFYEAVIATANLQTDLEKLENSEVREIDIERGDPERLLKAVLDEILYLKDADLFFVKDVKIEVQLIKDRWNVQGKFTGDIFDTEIHPMWNDLKAVTWHDFYVKEVDEGWECYVLIDI